MIVRMHKLAVKYPSRCTIRGENTPVTTLVKDINTPVTTLVKEINTPVITLVRTSENVTKKIF